MQTLHTLVQDAKSQIVALAQEALRQRSLSGHEKGIADLFLHELDRYGVETWRDAAGNVFGRLPGDGGLTTMLHAHMDVVDPGDESRWRHPPFGGVVDEGYLWGRGSSDTKGSLVAQVSAVGLLRRAGLRPPGDVFVAGAVGEETGGYGTRHMVKTFPEPLGVVIIGEPSGNTLRRGHRGRYEFVVTFRGRSAHASNPNLGRNPHYAMARFLLALREAPMVEDDVLPASSVVPTLSYVDTTSSNVIPADIAVHLDWRAAPADTIDRARSKVEGLATEALEEGITFDIEIFDQPTHSYTGLEVGIRHELAGFCHPLDDPLLLAAHAALEEGLGRPVPIDVWTFCTDGGVLAAHGVHCLGFGPGDETTAHILDERLSIDELLEATVGYMALALRMGQR